MKREFKLSVLDRLAVVSILVSSSAVSSVAFAQGDKKIVGSGEDPFTNVTSTVCNVAEWLQGPVGLALGFLVLVGGIIAMQVASRDALPMIGRALVGTALLLGAGTAFGAIITPSSCEASADGGISPTSIREVLAERPSQFAFPADASSV